MSIFLLLEISREAPRRAKKNNAKKAGRKNRKKIHHVKYVPILLSCHSGDTVIRTIYNNFGSQCPPLPPPVPTTQNSRPPTQSRHLRVDYQVLHFFSKVLVLILEGGGGDTDLPPETEARIEWSETLYMRRLINTTSHRTRLFHHAANKNVDIINDGT